ncbi:MAG: hypothetical protein LBD35_00930 [Prevotellaceae bacterium]|nr:hypothetical protein [Prevotellaceae bacterium]
MKLKCLLIMMLFACRVEAQYVDYGNDPARLKWRLIRTERHKVIFPAGFETGASIYASILEAVYPHVRYTMSAARSSTMPVVLHPFNAHHNGMVAWAPKRMELLPAPEFGYGFQIRELGLSLHESRHAAQIDRLNCGLFRPFHLIIGQQAAGLSLLFVPEWFLEGEAVLAETALSSSGRGREPSFLMPYRAQLAAGKNYSFDKWLLGSYRNFTHNHYALGYMMTARARIDHGADVWDKVLKGMTRTFPPIFALSMRKYAGMKTNSLFDSAMTSAMRDFPTPANPDRPAIMSPDSGEYLSYLHPQETEYGIISLKKSLYDIPSIVLTDSAGDERRLAYTGAVNSKLSYSDGYVYWTEYVPGLRWRHESWSAVKRLRVETKKIETISPRRSKHFTPTPFPGNRIAVYEYSPDGRGSLAILDPATKTKNSYPVFRNLQVQDMTADANGKIFASITGAGNGIFRFDTLSAEWTGFLAYCRASIRGLRMHGGELIFESGYSGIDNIYAFDTLSLKVRRLTDARFGAFGGTFSSDGAKLYFSDYSANGYRLASLPAEKLNRDAIDFKTPFKFGTAEALSAQEIFNADDSVFTVKHYESKPYGKAAHLFNFHSWLPAFYDLDELRNDFGRLIEFKPGISLLSQNALNTLVSQASYYYAPNGHHGYVSLKYSGFFPVFHLKLDVGGRRAILDDPQAVSVTRRINAVFLAYLPLSFTRDHWVHGLQPYLYYRFGNDRLSKIDANYSHVNGGITYYRYRSLAHRDIFPKSGWRLRLEYAGNPRISMGQLLVANANVWFPGLIRNHGLKTTLAFQKQFAPAEGGYFFPERYVEIARKTSYRVASPLIYTVKGDYSFPILYPDWNIGSLLYFKRLRGNVFYDYTCNRVFDSETSGFLWRGQSSCGLDLTLDLHPLQFLLAPASITFRLAKYTGVKSFKPEIIWGISI